MEKEVLAALIGAAALVAAAGVAAAVAHSFAVAKLQRERRLDAYAEYIAARIEYTAHRDRITRDRFSRFLSAGLVVKLLAPADVVRHLERLEQNDEAEDEGEQWPHPGYNAHSLIERMRADVDPDAPKKARAYWASVVSRADGAFRWLGQALLWPQAALSFAKSELWSSPSSSLPASRSGHTSGS